MRRFARAHIVPAIRAIDRIEQWVAAARLLKTLANLRRRDAHGLIGNMTGSAGTPVRAKTLKECAIGVGMTIDVEGFNRAARIGGDVGFTEVVRTRNHSDKYGGQKRCLASPRGRLIHYFLAPQ